MQSLPKSLFIFVFCVPLAIVLGFMLATPLDRTTLLFVLGGFLLLLTPILLKNHHTILIVSWNAYISAFFLPGKPFLWMLAGLISLFFLILTMTLNRGKMQLLSVPSVNWPIIAIAIVTLVTAELTGGIGGQALGSDVYGGKRYLYIWIGMLAYIALSSVPMKREKRKLLAGLFMLSSATAIVGNIAYALGDKFYFLFLLFPVEWALTEAASDQAIGGITRIGGLAPASVAVVCFCMVLYGFRGTFSVKRPWRMFLLVGAIVAGLFSGFRSTFLLALLVIVVQFFVEGLHKTRLLMVFGFSTVLLAVAILPNAGKLPLPVQRCLTVLPLDLDRAAVEAARGSTDWRVEMWRAIVPDIPKYLFVGKGYALDPKDLYFSQTHISLMYYAPYEASLVAGDYHNGPLTLIIPFGIWGVLSFTWFCWASLRVLSRNAKYGEADMRTVNQFLYGWFIAKLIFFITIFGAFYLDLPIFLGIVGFSISLNRGMASPGRAPAAEKAEAEAETERAAPVLQPAFARRLQPGV